MQPWNGQTGQTDDDWVIGGTRLRSRLFLGTGRFPSPAVMLAALDACGADVVTFAVRRVNLEETEDDSLLQHLEERPLVYLPNTSGARTAAEAVRIASLARAAGLGSWIKVEISADSRTLLPDPLETLRATELLVQMGFTVLPYTSDDPILCRRLEEAGAAAVMPGGSPIGTGLGILNPYNIGLIAEQVRVPVIVDAGLGAAADAAQAMELGADGVLVNTPVARATDPVAMARAMAMAVEAGRLARLAGRIGKRRYASASSPEDGYLSGTSGESGGAAEEAAGRLPVRAQAGAGFVRSQAADGAAQRRPDAAGLAAHAPLQAGPAVGADPSQRSAAPAEEVRP